MIREFRHHPSWYAFSCLNEAQAEGDPVKNVYCLRPMKPFDNRSRAILLGFGGGGDQWPTDVISEHGTMDKADAPEQPGASHTAADYRSRPHVWHEFNNQYIAPLPDLEIERRLTGVMTQAWVLEPHRRRLESYGLLSRYPELRNLSIRLYRNYVKQVFESARRMPRLDGYAWWVVNDIPAGVECDVTSYGVLDMLYQPEKFTFEEFRQYNRESVLTMDIPIDARVIKRGESRPIRIALSHYGSQPVEEGNCDGKSRGLEDARPKACCHPFTPHAARSPNWARFTSGPSTTYSLENSKSKWNSFPNACRQSNAWDFWVFPREEGGYCSRRPLQPDGRARARFALWGVRRCAVGQRQSRPCTPSDPGC